MRRCWALSQSVWTTSRPMDAEMLSAFTASLRLLSCPSLRRGRSLLSSTPAPLASSFLKSIGVWLACSLLCPPVWVSDVCTSKSALLSLPPTPPSHPLGHQSAGLSSGFYGSLPLAVWFTHSSSCSATQSCLTQRPHGLQHARLPCPSLSPRVRSNSCPLSRCCHPTITSCVIPVSCRPSSPASGSFPMSRLFTHSSVYMSVLFPQFIPTPCLLCHIHTSVLYVCVSIPAIGLFLHWSQLISSPISISL